MIKDPTDQFIKHILENCDIKDKTILEVGCGDGRITRDLSRYAKKVVATDPDNRLLQQAKSEVVLINVDFKNIKGEELLFDHNSFDIVIYGLSLHHIPINKMKISLIKSTEVLKRQGKIIVIEPCDGGTILEAEKKFGAGDGGEKKKKDAAEEIMRSLDGWRVGKDIFFETLFYFNDQKDFFENIMHKSSKPKKLIQEIKEFLAKNKKGDKIILNAERRMNLLSRRV